MIRCTTNPAAKLPENGFAISYLGREFRFGGQNALEQLELPVKATELAGKLGKYAIQRDAIYPLAYNCVLLWQVLEGEDRLSRPQDALYRFTLRQIAELAERYFAHGDLPFDEDWQEWGSVSAEGTEGGMACTI